MDAGENLCDFWRELERIAWLRDGSERGSRGGGRGGAEELEAWLKIRNALCALGDAPGASPPT